jgi:hypothetical protein
MLEEALGMFTSEWLQEGQIYTREHLREHFQITDQTLFTGIFRPAGHNSMWIFITEQKTPDRTQYIDHLDSDTLSWQGQTQGLKDQLIIGHKSKNLELLVFYRKSKSEHPGAGFRDVGRFEYISHQGSHPTSFRLERIDRVLETVQHDLEAQLAEEEWFTEGKHNRVLVNRYERDAKLRAAASSSHQNPRNALPSLRIFIS